MSDQQRAFYEKKAIEGKGFLAGEPDIPPDGEEAYEAFWALTSSRSIGMGVGGIPFLAIDRYADRYGTEDFETFHHLLREMDGAYLRYMNKRKD